MAEFKLGRIRFVWKNNWVTSTTYYVDDVVLVNGKTYICVTGHTSLSDFNLDLNNSKWQLMTDGQKWRNNWLADTQYQLNDLVKYGAIVYICTQGHMSQSLLESDQAKWNVFATGSFDWKNNWGVSTTYKVGDLVKYGAGLYRCIEGHTSAATLTLGLEPDNLKWNVVSIGFEYKSNWTGNTRYKINDVVKQGGGLWLSLIGHTSDATDFTVDAAHWEQFVEGLEFEDTWNIATAYQAGDIVNYGGYQYVAITNHTGTKPTTLAQTDWDLFSTGFSHQGEYNNATAYKVGHVVRVGGYTYVAKADTTGNRPPNPTYWERLNQGQEWNGAWVNASFYDIGDLVKYDNSSYICVVSHTSDQVTAQNRPDQDLLGATWNQMVGGAETTVLTTKGDMVYYTGAGPSRLPIGTDGQVLKVSGTDLIWDDFGIINNVFYVSTTGVDAIDYGYTLDKPFKTVRYGLEKIEAGHNRTGSKRLLELNRSFIQAEVAEYVTYQIANPSGIWTGFVNDNEYLTREEFGKIVDAIIWDLSHGGNKRTRDAVLTYFNGALLKTALADENDQLAAALGYMLTVVDAVISNLAPAVNYQTLNSVASPITQQINTALIKGDTDQTIINALLNVITTALVSESLLGIPVEIKPNSTLFVKTGIFSEVLPLIVPEQTAVVGDELRSTKITPAGSLVALGDVPYSLDALSRLAAIMSNIVANPGAVIKTAGNALNPVTTRPRGSVGAGTVAANLVQQIYDYIDYGISGATGDSTIPLISGTNTPLTSTGYTYAVESIEANRAFIVAEILRYIAVTYPGYVYNTVSCARDVNAYLDAVKYDLIYTGNYKSLLAARYYLNAVNGSLLQDMFYVRDGSGIRNCTLSGLTGTLSSPNAYGTQRPSAGAYVSLDAGWGPEDTRVWISNRSPYIQNVTTFGTACVGLKVDGALHAGGNDSIVANDFTQVLSDGIGYWVTNLGRSELVSVFTYYNHIGYLAENGGKIRATNGNNSYGKYGSVAEGVDSTEMPITGTINNRDFEAQIGRVFTDNDQLIALEYNNAGTNYTAKNNTYSFSGIGYNHVVVGDEIRDNAVFEVRMLSVGEDYRSSSNTAQSGSTSTIILAGSETAPSLAYAGMRIFVRSGPGAGQYGYVDSYNSATKVANILKESNGTAGWDHIILGTTIVAPTAISTYSVEPRISVTAPSAPTYNSATYPNSGTYRTSNVYKGVAYGNDKWVAVSSTNTNSIISTARNTWVAGSNIWIAGGATPTAQAHIAYGNISSVDYFVTLPTASSNAGAYSTDNGATWNAMTLPSSANWISIAFSGTRFMAISSVGNIAISTNGTTWSALSNLPATGGTWKSLVYGLNKWVAISTGANTSAYSTDNGVSWSPTTLPSSTKWTSIAYGNSRFVAVAGIDSALTTAAYSFNGINWSSSTLPSSKRWEDVSYGQGIFHAISNDAVPAAATSKDGILWTASTLTTANNHYATVFGNADGQPTWVTVGGSGSAAVCQFHKNVLAAFLRGFVQSGQLAAIRIVEPGSGYDSAPSITITDPNNTVEATYTVRIGDGALAQPSFVNRGQDWETAEGFVTGNGFADAYQDGTFVNVSGLTDIPNDGANITFAGDSTFYKIVNVTSLLGTPGSYTAKLQVSPAVSIANAPEHNVNLEVRIRYSQVRLTGHDFLDIGTGNFTDTNYPGISLTAADPDKETNDSGGGRVFYTSTDQDGNFRVGQLFSVEQSTGRSTLNADAFNLAGLQELQLGTIQLGGSNTSVNEFSTDGTFAANSDSIVPTQKAIRTYIQSQIGGGGSNLNVNSITAGQVIIQLNSISHVGGQTINITSRANFTGGISGTPLALNYFLQK